MKHKYKPGDKVWVQAVVSGLQTATHWMPIPQLEVDDV
jgi:hypothetical protein